MQNHYGNGCYTGFTIDVEKEILNQISYPLMCNSRHFVFHHGETFEKERMGACTLAVLQQALPMSNMLTRIASNNTIYTRSLLILFCVFPNIANLPQICPHDVKTKWLPRVLSPFQYLWDSHSYHTDQYSLVPQCQTRRIWLCKFKRKLTKKSLYTLTWEFGSHIPCNLIECN